MIVIGGVLMIFSGVALIDLGQPLGWLVLAAGFVAALGGMYHKMR